VLEKRPLIPLDEAKMNLRLVWCVGLSLLGSVATGAGASGPNFLVVLADDLGWGDLACQGHPHIRTPHLDRLAAEGIRFTSCYTAAPVCSPARVGLLTGRNPVRAGVFDWIPAVQEGKAKAAAGRNLVHLRRQEVTLPQLLRQVGYATALCGKWHCNARFNHPDQPQPGDAGFDHWFATQNNAAPSHRNPTNYVRNGQPVGPLVGYSCHLAAQEAIQWLENQQKRNPQQPFFLYVAFHEPHEPVASPPELVAHYRGKARNDDEAEYFANVENLDAAVGRLLAALERLKVAPNTVVFFSSDNGPETLKRYPTARRSYGSPGPLRGMKLWTTEGGVRVPGILRWPAQVSPGQVCDAPISGLDLLPTFARLAGAKIPTDLELDGTDIAPLFRGGQLQRPQPLVWIYFNAINDQRVALRDGPWKLLAKLDNGRLPKMANVTDTTAPRVRRAALTDFSLYRLTEDLGETQDLSAQQPDTLNQLSTKLQTLYRHLTATMHVWSDAAQPAPAQHQVP